MNRETETAEVFSRTLGRHAGNSWVHFHCNLDQKLFKVHCFCCPLFHVYTVVGGGFEYLLSAFWF